MSAHRRHRLVDTACVLALIGLAAMTWSVLDPRPVPVFIAMSVGQAIGTLSLLLFLLVLVLGASRSKTDRGATP
jgi:hypothetical protein